MKLIRWTYRNMELLFWISAVVILFCMRVDTPETSLCVFSLMGFGTCPGCGIGHAIHYALHLDPAASFQHHILGIPAVIIIFIRTKRLLQPPKQTYETQPSEPHPRHRG